jgi:hypothetical protein
MTDHDELIELRLTVTEHEKKIARLEEELREFRRSYDRVVNFTGGAGAVLVIIGGAIGWVIGLWRNMRGAG